jgi:nicotinate-nucleotide adenylyltransferase
MLKLVKNKNFIISDIETKNTIQAKTIETLAKLNKKNIRLLIGSDNLLNLKNWFSYEELIIKYKPIIVERGRDNAKKIIETYYKKYAKHFDVIKGIIHSDDSSTFIRENIKKTHSCRYYLPEEIIRYIKKHKLYEQNN